MCAWVVGEGFRLGDWKTGGGARIRERRARALISKMAETGRKLKKKKRKRKTGSKV